MHTAPAHFESAKFNVHSFLLDLLTYTIGIGIFWMDTLVCGYNNKVSQSYRNIILSRIQLKGERTPSKDGGQKFAYGSKFDFRFLI